MGHANAYFNELHSSLSQQYAINNTVKATLAANKTPFNNCLKDAEKAFKRLFDKQGYKPEDLLSEPDYRKLINSFNKTFSSAIPHTVSDTLRDYLEQDIFVFSGLRTHAQLTEARSYLKDENGNIRSWSNFEQKVTALNKTYNLNYLEAEYEFAVHSAQSADKWESFSDDTERYYLQYRTAGDDKVRVSHSKLNGITLPKDDPFWDEYFAPNGWRCRCVIIEVLARKYQKSDSKEAIAKGEKATTQLNKDGKNKLAMFRFNPGKNKKVFPPGNSYTKVTGAKKLIPELKTTAQLSSYMAKYAAKHNHMFQHGYNKLMTTTKRGVNGYTDMRGTIALKGDIMKEAMAGINNINKGIKTSFTQERALSTLHHEIVHNANKPGIMRLSRIQTMYMETANEFVSRKRLPNFMKTLGGELQNASLIDNRDNTGYNTWVRNYDYVVKLSKADKTKVLTDVESHLINEPYTSQKDGLINALVNNSSLKKREAADLVTNTLKYSEDGFKSYVDSKGLFKTK